MLFLRRVSLILALLPLPALADAPCPAPVQRACLLEAAMALAADAPHAMAGVAGALVLAGQVDRAQALAATLPENVVSDARLQMARAHVDRGELEVALVLADSLAGAGQMHEGLLRDIAGALAQAGQPDRALVLTEGITQPQILTDALDRIATAQIGQGQADAARATAGLMPIAAARAEVLARIAGALADPALLAEVEAQIAALPEAHRRAPALGLLAEAQARAGLSAQAVATAEGIDAPQVRAVALGRVAVVLGDAAGIDTAVAAAEAIGEGGMRGFALMRLGALLERADLLAAARDAFLTIPLPSIREIGLQAQFDEELRLGRIDDAVLTARSFAEPGRVAALLARAHAARPDPDLLAEALAVLADEPVAALRVGVLARLAAALPD